MRLQQRWWEKKSERIRASVGIEFFTDLILSTSLMEIAQEPTVISISPSNTLGLQVVVVKVHEAGIILEVTIDNFIQ